MAHIAKRKRSDDCVEEGLFGADGLMFGRISTSDGIKAQGEFHRGSLTNGKLFTDEFMTKGEYIEGRLLTGCRLHYSPSVYEFGTFHDNHLQTGVRASPTIVFSGKFDDNDELYEGVLIDKHVSQGVFINNLLKEGTKIVDNVVYKGNWSLAGEFLNGTKLYPNGRIERGKFEDDELLDGIAITETGKLEKYTEVTDNAPVTFPV